MGRLTKADYRIEKPILLGERVDAEYNDQVPAIYKGNPFIEALPNILTEGEIPDKIAYYPEYCQSERNLPAEIRYHYVHTLEELIQPLDKHYEIERNISIMLRTGYRVRNPLSKEYAAQFYKDSSDIVTLPRVPKRPNLKGLTIIGISGIGKSTAVEQVLLTYPQVIQHVSYRGVPLILKQLVWVKIDCPYGGSSKVMCEQFFRTVDAALETDYYQQYSKARFTESQLLDRMENIIRLYGLGILVLDELQFLNVAHSGGYDKLLNFFTKLSNNLGIPIVLIGTYKSLGLFRRELYQSRRGSAGGFGNIFWDCMEIKTKEWSFFLETIWKYQWTKTHTPLTKRISDAIHDESQGITGIAVILYVLSQKEAIARGREEKITATLIRDVAKESLKILRPMLQLLKLGDYQELMKIDDLQPSWVSIKDYFAHSGDMLSVHGRLRERLKIEPHNFSKNYDPLNQLIAFALDIGTEKSFAEKVARQVLKGSKEENNIVALRHKVFEQITSKEVPSEPQKSELNKPKGRKNTASVPNILETVRQGIEKKIIPYESLKKAGYIKSPQEFFPVG